MQLEVTNSCMMAVRSKQWGFLECRNQGRAKVADHLWLAVNSTGIKGVSQLDPEMLQSELEDEKKENIFLFVYVQMPFLYGNWK